jgi:hypothetical protein
MILVTILTIIILYLYSIGLYFFYEFISDEWEWSLLLWPFFFISIINDNTDDKNDNINGQSKQAYFTS